MDRKIVEGFLSGQSATLITKVTGKGKGYVIRVRDHAVEYGYLTANGESNQKIFTKGPRDLPVFPAALFPLLDGRSERVADTDVLLGVKREWIKERLEVGWSPQTIFEEMDLAVPRSNFYRYLHRQKLMKAVPSRHIMELIHAPGECLQVDWGRLFDVVDKVTGKKRTIWIFIGVLGHSRYEMARVVERLDFATTIDVVISMLEELGGVPRKVTSDNPKVFVREASRFEPFVNPAFERFAGHYGFIVEALPPASPEKKGKVERMVPVKRRLFESYNLEEYTLESAQGHLDRKLRLTNERRHGTHQEKPLNVFLDDEAGLLRPLPTLRYELETIESVTVRADGYVRFQNKYYRIDPRLKKESALVIANQSQVSIYVKGRLIEVYERITDKFITKACKEHLKEPWEKTLNDHGHYLKRAADVGPDVERFIAVILSRGQGFVDTRVVWGLLTLNKKYQNSDVNRACHSALELSQVNLATVRQLLNLIAKPNQLKTAAADKVLADTKTGGKFARPMSEYKRHLILVHNQLNKGQ